MNIRFAVVWIGCRLRVDFDLAPLYNQSMERSRRGGSRSGAGRKAVPDADKLEARSVYLTDAEWSQCKTRGEASGVSASEYVRGLVRSDGSRLFDVPPADLKFVGPGPT